MLAMNLLNSIYLQGTFVREHKSRRSWELHFTFLSSFLNHTVTKTTHEVLRQHLFWESFMKNLLVYRKRVKTHQWIQCVIVNVFSVFSFLVWLGFTLNPDCWKTPWLYLTEIVLHSKLFWRTTMNINKSNTIHSDSLLYENSLPSKDLKKKQKPYIYQIRYNMYQHSKL